MVFSFGLEKIYLESSSSFIPNIENNYVKIHKVLCLSLDYSTKMILFGNSLPESCVCYMWRLGKTTLGAHFLVCCTCYHPSTLVDALISLWQQLCQIGYSRKAYLSICVAIMCSLVEKYFYFYACIEITGPYFD